MMWGLVPSWHKGDPKKVSYETNNCRAEGMLEKRTYKVPLDKGRRCVVLADGFYEWKRDKDQKQPYFIYFPRSSSGTKDENVDNGKIKQEVKMEDSDWLAMKEEPADKITDIVSDSREFEDRNKEGDVKTVQDLKDVKQECEIKKEIKTEPNDLLQYVNFESNVKFTSDISDFPDHGDGDTKSPNISTKQGNDDTGENIPSKRLLTMAGVFDVWSPPDGSPPLYTYSVITVAASPAMDWLHHRMPAILTSEAEINEWLDFGDVPLLKAVKNIRPVECIQLHPVSTVVNKSCNNTPDCIEPIDLKKPKKSASSNLMMSWLSKPKKEGVSAVKVSESPPKKKKKTESSVMMGWLNKTKKS
ncbi:embryonic stem cell-specific 5-hydroxymethylcytosine-binding protein-like isoform X2 [Mizuhopecten yessoensis]|nr:embryonic stem cell-specific 5-hydroxymethylcytosine-binding protein-like isoform X2 [Mizuhopecten yessoensis]